MLTFARSATFFNVGGVSNRVFHVATNTTPGRGCQTFLDFFDLNSGYPVKGYCTCRTIRFRRNQEIAHQPKGNWKLLSMFHPVQWGLWMSENHAAVRARSDKNIRSFLAHKIFLLLTANVSKPPAGAGPDATP